MKKILLIILISVFSLGVIIFLFLAWHGAFSKPVVIEKEMGPYFYVYEDYKGKYKETTSVFERVNSSLSKIKVMSPLGIGIYLDDPQKVRADQLRSQCGSIYNIEDSARVAQLNLKKGKLDLQKFMVIEFPIKTPLSYWLGPTKCYPILFKYMQDKKYKNTQPYEIYDMQNKITYYIAAISE